MTTIDVLTEARRLIEEKGWIQFQNKGPLGFCVSGACWAAARPGNSRSDCSDYNTAMVEIGKTVERIGVTSWNDAPYRTKADVLDAIDRTIARLR